MSASLLWLARFAWLGRLCWRFVVMAERRFSGFVMLGMRLHLFVWFAEISRAAFARFALVPLGFTGAALMLFAGLPMSAALGFAGAITQLAQGPAQRFDLAFVRELLAFREFHQFQNFFHLIHRALERFNDLHHFVNRLMDGGGAMLGFAAAHAFGQIPHAFEQGADRLRRGAGRQRFMRGSRRTHGCDWSFGRRSAGGFTRAAGAGNFCRRGLRLLRAGRGGGGIAWWQARGLAATPPAASAPAPAITAVGRGFIAGRLGTAGLGRFAL